MHNNEHLCCRFHVVDTDVKVYVDKNHKKEVVHGDRVEMFLTADEKLDTYYCLEIDPNGRVFDYAASFYRKFHESWQWPVNQLHVESDQGKEGYSILYSVTLSSLHQLGLIKNNELQVGLYRGRCMEINLENEKMQWASWVEPDSVKPDFHIPSSFGVFKLE